MSGSRSGWLQRLLLVIGAVQPAAVDAVEDVRPGRVQLVGTLKCASPLHAPVSGRTCAAFMYSASALGSGRSSVGGRMRLLRRASVYAPDMTLRLRDGEVSLSAPPSDDFDGRAHTALVEMDLAGFKARERTLRSGARVRVFGKALPRTEQGLTIAVTTIEPVAADDSGSPRAKA